VCKRRLVLGCPPLAHTLSMTYRTMVLNYVHRNYSSIIDLDTYTILVKYLVQENGGRKINDKSVVCVVCCKKLLSTNTIDFINSKYEMYI
jgi:hypothetical protein